MKSQHLVSVIIPVCNGEKYLSEAIDSVLFQSYRPIEVFVVDDGSTDGSRDIAEAYPEVTYLYQTNAGPASARNRGIQAAKGEYIAFIDADDIWMPEKLTLQMVAFATDPDLDIVTGYVDQFLSPELDFPGETQYKIPSAALPGYVPTAVLVTRDVFDVIGLFHEEYHVGETISWFSTALDSGLNIKVLPDIIARRRIHGENISIQHQKKKKSAILKILKNRWIENG